MPSTHTSLDYHIIFSTKDREPFLVQDCRDEVHRFLGGWIRNASGVAWKVGGVADHVHIAAALKPTHCVSDLLRELKHDSSDWIHTRFRMPSFHWQVGYGAFTFSRRQRDAVVSYVEGQAEHHRIRTFQEEYREFLEAYGVEFDERYLW